MKLKNIDLKGWRSFSNQEGISLNELNDFNLFIGPNNVGKSNLSKFFLWLSKELSEGKLNHSSSSLPEIFYKSKDGFLESFPESDFWDSDCPRISLNATFRTNLSEIIFKNGDGTKFPSSENEITLGLQPSTDEFQQHHLLPFPILPFGTELGELNKGEWIKKVTIDASTQNREIAHKHADRITRHVRSFLSEIGNSFIFFHPIRDLERKRATGFFDFDGSKLIDELVSILENKSDPRKWRNLKRQLEKWMKEITGEDHFEIELLSGSKTIRFVLRRNSQEKTHLLDGLGEGIKQIFIILSRLFLAQDKELNVFIDEPENSLHPQALIQLFDILTRNNFSKHRFFISSHSPSLLDLADDRWEIFQTRMDTKEGTKFNRCNNLTDSLGLLDSIGVRASQLLQSNIVLWVEGPSDRLYLKKWIKLFSGGRLLEGKHYSFAFFGGSLLKYYGIGESNHYSQDLISLFSTSRFSIVICDSDKKNHKDSSKRVVDNLSVKVKEAGIDNYVFLFETWGREIENYIPIVLWKSAFEEDKFIRKSLQDPNKMIEFTITQGDDLRFKDFAVWLSECYESSNSSVPLTKVDRKKLKQFHDSQKAKLALFISNIWEEKHFSEELTELVNTIVKKIGVANGMAKYSE